MSAVVLLACLVVIACKKKEQDGAAAAAPAGGEQPATEPAAASGAAAVGEPTEPAQPAAVAKRKAIAVAAAESVACALMDDGTVRCWGEDAGGALGDNETEEDSASPVQVAGISGAKALDIGGRGTGCAQLEDGSMKCWGFGAMLCREEYSAAPTPVEMPALAGVKQFDLGQGDAPCAVKADGTVACWGSGRWGLHGVPDKETEERLPVAIPGVTDAVKVACGRLHTCALLGSGKVTCWGTNTWSLIAPERSNEKIGPTEIAGVTDAVDIMSAGDLSCLRKKDGTAHCWGGINYGKGLQAVPEWDGVQEWSGRSGVQCAVLADGVVKCRGYNDHGQLGVGDTEKHEGCVVPSGLGQATGVAVGDGFACAVLADGSVSCWGKNARGNLGNGTLVDSGAPVAVKYIQDETLPPLEDGYATTPPSGFPVQQFPAELPEGCTRPETIVAKGFMSKVDTIEFRSASAILDEGKMRIDIANVDREDLASFFDGEFRGNQMRFRLLLRHVAPPAEEGGVGEVMPIDVGTYVFQSGNERWFSLGYNHKHVSGGIEDQGTSSTVTLTHVSDQLLCGTLSISAGAHEMSGPFIAPVVTKAE